MKPMYPSRAFAYANIALIKYWGKYNLEHNIPLVTSLSLTLDNYGTLTTITATDHEHDIFILNNVPQVGLPTIKVQRFLNYIRTQVGSSLKCQVESTNNFPTKSGLASSASGFAALALAAANFYAWDLSKRELSRLARRGSASAARSIFGGLVLLHGGALEETQSYAEPIPAQLDLNMLIVQCSDQEKSVSSTDGMRASAATSPFFPVFVDQQMGDIDSALHAIALKDLVLLGETMEYSTLKMHSCCLSSNPGFCYWNPSTVRIMDAVKKLRKQGAQCYFTMDAGPHVKILCPADQSEEIRAQLINTEGITCIDKAAPGRAAYMLRENET